MELFSTNEVHPREIKIKGETGTVYVRKLPALDLRRFYEETRSDDMDVRLNAGFRALSKAIRKEDGSPRMTFEEAQRLSLEATKELTRVFMDVNKADDDPGND